MAIASSFIDYINRAVSPFHAVQVAKETLLGAGFIELLEHEPWSIAPGQRYFFTRNLSSIYAFSVASHFDWSSSAFRIIGTHTDSPCPKLAPISRNESQEMVRLNVQLYGGGLWHSWLDRDLTVAGRVVYKQGTSLKSSLVHIERPIINMPQLCIHLSSVRDKFEYNKESHIKPIIASILKEKATDPSENKRHPPGLLRIVSEKAGCQPEDVTDLELCLVDAEPSRITGLYEEFISSGRLDNLMSTFCALQALVASGAHDKDIILWSAFDNEEIGSTSMQGADSIIIEQTMKRILNALPAGPSKDAVDCVFRRTFIVSADMAHAIHPNYPEKHQTAHAPKMHKGTVIKTNANQRYATDGVGASYFRDLSQRYGIPIQEVIVKNDSPCGSTIGPFLAAKSGCRTIDIGAPQYAMHSCRELMGVDDANHYFELMKAFFSDETPIASEAFLR